VCSSHGLSHALDRDRSRPVESVVAYLREQVGYADLTTARFAAALRELTSRYS
jgi:hypothetical protein